MQYRDDNDEYRRADRVFKIGDRVVFVGPPPEMEQPCVISPSSSHKLMSKKGKIAYGPSESFRCYPDEPANSHLGRMVWVEFDGDEEPIRQVDRNWLVRESEFNR